MARNAASSSSGWTKTAPLSYVGQGVRRIGLPPCKASRPLSASSALWDSSVVTAASLFLPTVGLLASDRQPSVGGRRPVLVDSTSAIVADAWRCDDHGAGEPARSDPVPASARADTRRALPATQTAPPCLLAARRRAVSERTGQTALIFVRRLARFPECSPNVPMVSTGNCCCYGSSVAVIWR